TFRYNNYGVHLRLPYSPSGDLNPDINIQDATFEENLFGIEMHEQNGEIVLKNCTFMNNSEAGIYFNEDIPESIISVENCKFDGVGGSYCIYSKDLYDLKILNCEFKDSYCGVFAKSSTGLEIVGNKFENTIAYGVKLENSDCEIKSNNEFYSWQGIAATSDQPGVGSVKVTDGNYFDNVIFDINLAGMDSYEQSAIAGNYFNDCIDGILIEGSNYYIVNDNTFYDIKNSVFASSTGYYPNKILCNFMDKTSEYGIELKNNNYSTTFMGNYFSNSELADVKIDGTIENHIGDDTHPAENHFSVGSGDIKVSDNTPYFHYFLAPDADPDTDPDNSADDDIPESWEQETSIYAEIPECVMPPGTIETNFEEWWQYYCEQLQEYEDNPNETLYGQIKLLEIKLQRQIYYLCYKTGLDYRTMLDIMMQYCDNFFSQKVKYYLYLHYGDCEKADSMLSVVEYTLDEPVGSTRMDSLERISKQAFVNINRIGIRYHCDITAVDSILKTDTLFKF
ncbi:MAG TPA: right-handed parallel beta-helix repeat-containing protein, partial [Bacteroidetes bacterium]|nr:right-handed parallel beta-helix repeat-containing protein [Bacteroidota bacterium]